MWLRVVFSITLMSAMMSSNVWAGCDSCVTSAVNGLTSTVSQQLSIHNDSLGQIKESIDNFDDTVNKTSSNIEASLQSFETSLTNKFDQTIKASSASFKSLNKNIALNTDMHIAQIEKLFKDIDVQDNKYLAALYASKPMSLDKLGEQSTVIPYARNRSLEFKHKHNEVFDAWITGAGNEWLKGRVNREQKAEFINNNLSKLSLLSNDLITEDDATVLADMFKHLLSPTPEPASQDLSGERQAVIEIDKQKRNLKDKIAYEHIIEYISKRRPVVDRAGWDDNDSWGYLPTIDKDERKMTSMVAMEKYNTESKATSLAWNEDISSKLHTAATKEMAVQSLQQAKLLSELVRLEEQALLLDLVNAL